MHSSAKNAAEWSVYLLKSLISNRSYIGYTRTNNIFFRLSQHNGLKAGGAKTTHAFRPWFVVLSIDGMDRRSAMQLEWRLHRPFPRKGGIDGRINQISAALQMEKWTSTAIPCKQIKDLVLTWHHAEMEIPNLLSRWLKI